MLPFGAHVICSLNIEMFFEIYNFLKDIDVIDFSLGSTNLYRLMIEKGFNEQEIEGTLQNPTINVNGKSIALFSVTENKSTLEAIELYSVGARHLATL